MATSKVRTDLDLSKWVEGQTQLDSVSKYILEKLAVFADPEGCAWAKIDTLAAKCNVSDRTVQTRLRKLESEGLIENTGRTHRLRNSTRSVPIYQLAPQVEGFGVSVSMGENPAPIDGYGCKSDGGMGEAAFTPKEEIRTEGESYDSPMRERGRERAIFADIEAAYPRGGLKVTDREAAWQALCALADQGVAIDMLPACAAAMDGDPVLKRRDFGPPSMQAWMAKGQYRGWWPEPKASPAAEPDRPDPTDALPADVVEAFGAPFVRAWLGGATWVEETRTIVTVRAVQRDKLKRDCSGILHEHRLRVVAAVELQSMHHAQGVS